MRPNGTPEELERRRRRAVALLKERRSHSQVAEIVGASLGSIHRWKQMAAKGEDALSPVRHPGPPQRLSPEQYKKLEGLLLQGAKAHGWDNDLWTATRVNEVIRRNFRTQFHPEHARKILKVRLGWSSQRPERRARERNEEEIARWKRQE
jgi:transposase